MKDLEQGTVVCPKCSYHGEEQFMVVQAEGNDLILQCKCGAKFKPIIEERRKPLLSAVYRWNYTDYNWDEAEYINGYWHVPRVQGFQYC